MKTARPNKRAQTLLLGVSLGLVLVVLSVSYLRRTSWFANQAELPLYDHLTTRTWPWKTGHEDIVLVTIRDPSIWPLDDANLATCLENISAAEPKALAVDLIRDSYRTSVTLDAENGAARLDSLLTLNSRILMADGLSVGDDPGFKTLPLLEANPNALQRQVGFANFPRDGDAQGTVRKGLLLVWAKIRDGEGVRLSLPTLTAVISKMRNVDFAQWETQEEFEELVVEVSKKMSIPPDQMGGYSPNKSADQQFLLKFGPKLDSLFPNYSYHEVVHQMSEEEIKTAFNGKIVFLGTNDSNTAKDEIAVVGNPRLRGVKLLALATSQILRETETKEPPIRSTTDWQEDALVVFFAILAALTAWWASLRGTFLSLLCLPFHLSLTWSIGVFAMKNGLWVPMAGPSLAALSSGLLTTAFVTNRIRRDRQQFSSLLDLQVGNQVAEKIRAHRESLHHQEKIPPELFEGTSFFSDLIGFTGITNDFRGGAGSKDRTPELFDWLNNYLTAMVEIIIQHDGFIQKFNGDGIFAVFGYPNDPDHARKAVACALQIREQLPRLNQELPPNMPKYYNRIGLYSGQLHAGSVGGQKQLVFDFLGEVINKSARLETLEKSAFQPTADDPVRILIGDQTKESLASSVKTQLYQDQKHQLDQRLDERESVWKVI